MQNPAHEPVPIIGSDTSAIYLFFSTADLTPKKWIQYLPKCLLQKKSNNSYLGHTNLRNIRDQ